MVKYKNRVILWKNFLLRHYQKIFLFKIQLMLSSKTAQAQGNWADWHHYLKILEKSLRIPLKKNNWNILFNAWINFYWEWIYFLYNSIKVISLKQLNLKNLQKCLNLVQKNYVYRIPRIRSMIFKTNYCHIKYHET
jgi:hypothetical protein